MIRKCVFACLVLFVAAQSVIAKEPKELFNGKDLTGWEGDPRESPKPEDRPEDRLATRVCREPPFSSSRLGTAGSGSSNPFTPVAQAPLRRLRLF